MDMMSESMGREKALERATELKERFESDDGKIDLTMAKEDLHALTALIEQGLMIATASGDIQPAIKTQMAALELAYRLGQANTGVEEYAEMFGVVKAPSGMIF